MSARTDLFPTLFTPGAQLASKKPKHPHVVAVQPVGMLHVPSGRIVAGGAISTMPEDFAPFSRAVPPGSYPVEASVVTISGDESAIAAARIVLSREPVVTWEVAAGGSGGAPGYRDALGLFCDAQTLPALQAYIDAADGSEWWYGPTKIEGKGWEVACFTPDDARAETCALFRTNYDALAVSYWGLDASGAPALLVTDANGLPAT
jgi:hypothetical protein